jgi:hypothetical protein
MVVELAKELLKTLNKNRSAPQAQQHLIEYQKGQNEPI